MARLLKPEEVEHGTPAGAHWHRNQREKPCEPCRVARNAYERKRRGKPVQVAKTEVIKQLAFKTRVLNQMAELYPHAYKRLVDQELRKLRDGTN